MEWTPNANQKKFIIIVSNMKTTTVIISKIGVVSMRFILSKNNP